MKEETVGILILAGNSDTTLKRVKVGLEDADKSNKIIEDIEFYFSNKVDCYQLWLNKVIHRFPLLSDIKTIHWLNWLLKNARIVLLHFSYWDQYTIAGIDEDRIDADFEDQFGSAIDFLKQREKQPTKLPPLDHIGTSRELQYRLEDKSEEGCLKVKLLWIPLVESGSDEKSLEDNSKRLSKKLMISLGKLFNVDFIPLSGNYIERVGKGIEKVRGRIDFNIKFILPNKELKDIYERHNKIYDKFN